MNKTNVLTMTENAIVFDLYTKFGHSFKELNQSKLEFITDKQIKITVGHKKYAYIDVGSIIRIDVMEG